MLRSLTAVIIAVIAGLAVAKGVELIGLALFPFAEGASTDRLDIMARLWAELSIGYKIFLALGWTIGAFVASFMTLMIGKRWAPLGVLSGSAIGLQAVITLLYYPAEIWLWSISIIGVAAATLSSIKMLHAQRTYPVDTSLELFRDR